MGGIGGIMKTTLDLPDELIREAKLRAVLQGRTLRDLVAEYLRQGMGMTAPKLPCPHPGFCGGDG